MSWIKTRCWRHFLGRTRLLASGELDGPDPEVESGQSTTTATTVLRLLISPGLPLLLAFWDFLLTSTSPCLDVYLLLPLALPVGVTQTASSSRTLSLWSPCPSNAVQKYCCTSLFSTWIGQEITRRHPSVSPGWQLNVLSSRMLSHQPYPLMIWVNYLQHSGDFFPCPLVYYHKEPKVMRSQTKPKVEWDSCWIPWWKFPLLWTPGSLDTRSLKL